VVTVVNKREFTFTSGRADDFFGRGFLIWKTGANAGIHMPIRESVLSGDMSIKLFSEMYHDIEVGDTFDIVAGCRLRWQEDCKDKFNNLLNFQGEKDLPGMDKMTSPP
jgi:uncharacterized phage protein (TIGR02218 family)